MGIKSDTNWRDLRCDLKLKMKNFKRECIPNIACGAYVPPVLPFRLKYKQLGIHRSNLLSSLICLGLWLHLSCLPAPLSRCPNFSHLLPPHKPSTPNPVVSPKPAIRLIFPCDGPTYKIRTGRCNFVYIIRNSRYDWSFFHPNPSHRSAMVGNICQLLSDTPTL